MSRGQSIGQIERNDLIKKSLCAGIIGAGGGGFPLYKKFLSATDTKNTNANASVNIDVVIANGSECEPLLESDKLLMLKWPELVVLGIEHSMRICNAKLGIIAIKAEYKSVISSVQKVIKQRIALGIYNKNFFEVKVHLLESYYPVGDEFLLVYDTTKRIIPEGGLPLSVGVMVHNVLSLAQLSEAIDGGGIAVTSRLVTIVGEIEGRPKVFKVPIGISLNKLLSRVKLKRPIDELAFIDGGPMMGKLILDTEKTVSSSFCVGKRCSGVIVLPKEHLLVKAQEMSLDRMVKKSKASCCQCYRCSELCPRSLLGHSTLQPHQSMRMLDYNLSAPMEAITSAFLCSQCGVCELFACDVMGLSPRKVLAEYRRLLGKGGIKNPHSNRADKTLESLEYRKVPTKKLISKLNLTDYYNHKYECDYEMIYPSEIESVTINIAEHIGQAAKAIITIGDKVRLGDVIAITPGLLDNFMEGSKLGSIYHASINGVIHSISDSAIAIANYELSGTTMGGVR